MNAPTTIENKDLERLEKLVEFGKRTFEKVGIALTEIRDRRLYRKDFSTWEDYCQKRWGWTRQRAAQLIGAASVVQQLTDKMSTTVDTERTARELGKVEPEHREKVLKTIQTTGKPITAKMISITSRIVTGPEVPKDEEGCPIPAGILPLWRRRDEVSSVLSALSKVKCQIEKADKEDDPLWRECFLNKALAELQSVYANLATAKPYAVCSICQGRLETQPDKGCRGCKGRGFMSKFRWDRVPDTIKKIRASQQEKKETK